MCIMGAGMWMQYGQHSWRCRVGGGGDALLAIYYQLNLL